MNVKGNTVGSLSVNLSPRQKSILIGSLLGDGTLRRGENATNVNFKVEHGLAQKNYVFFKYRFFKEFVGTPPKLSFRHDSFGSRYPKSWWFRTFRCSTLNPYFRLFYEDGKKVIPEKVESLVEPLGLAIWAMDDGSSNNKRTAFYFNTHSFKIEDQLKLCGVLKKKFSLNARIHKDGDKHRVYIPVEDTRVLFDIVAPYLLPEFFYKFPEMTP